MYIPRTPCPFPPEGIPEKAISSPLGAQDGWRDLKGEVVPEIDARRWLNTQERMPTRDSMKGKVWLLEFFATH